MPYTTSSTISSTLQSPPVLPAELFVPILEQTYATATTEDYGVGSLRQLLPLRLVSRAFGQVVTPLIFQHVCLDSDEVQQAFAQLLDNRPDFGQYIRDLRFDHVHPLQPHVEHILLACKSPNLANLELHFEDSEETTGAADSADDSWQHPPRDPIDRLFHALAALRPTSFRNGGVDSINADISNWLGEEFLALFETDWAQLQTLHLDYDLGWSVFASHLSSHAYERVIIGPSLDIRSKSDVLSIARNPGVRSLALRVFPNSHPFRWPDTAMKADDLRALLRDEPRSVKDKVAVVVLNDSGIRSFEA